MSLPLAAHPVAAAPGDREAHFDEAAQRWVFNLPRRSESEVIDLLRQLVERCWDHVPFFQQRLPRSWSGDRMTDFQAAIPPMSKRDLRDGYPFGMLGVAPAALRRLHATSGTSGRPCFIGHTDSDLAHWTQLMGRTLRVADLRPGDRFYNAYSYGPFTGGQGYHQGASTIPGCCIVPAYAISLDRHVMLLRDLEITVLGCTPHHALSIAGYAVSHGIELPHLRVIVTGSEFFSEAIRATLLRQLPALQRVVDVYGFGEAMGPGVAVECQHPDAAGSLHLWDDQFFVEVLDPQQQPLPDGAEGELVVTPLFRQASPLLRYRTGDRTRIVSRQPCPCGLHTVRIARITDRLDEVIFINGASFFPSEVALLLPRCAHLINPNYFEIHIITPAAASAASTELASDRVVIRVETLADAAPTPLVTITDAVRTTLQAGFIALFSIEVEVCPAGSLPRYEGKSTRIFRRTG